ncbi:ATP-binding protein [Aestuariivirga sp.]|uniref:ATP-binding protein n=1 Tax=Aestuariivirga sp. TaxID=2650926 RepID=UPI003BAA2D89
MTEGSKPGAPRLMRTGSLRLRLLSAAAISIVIAMCLTGFALNRLFENQVRDRVIKGLEDDLLQIAGSVELTADGKLKAGNAPSDMRYQQPYSGRYWRIAVTEAPPGMTVPKPLLSSSLWDYDLAGDGTIGPEHEPLMTVRQVISIASHGVPLKLSVLVAADESEVVRPLTELQQQLLLAFSLICAVLIAGAWLQVTVGLRPLKQLAEDLAEIRKGTAFRLSGSFPVEVAPLVTELNDVLDLRDASLDRARRRAGDLAHGLKTPLTVLSAVARHLRREGRAVEADDIEEQADLMLRHVERALVRARLSSGKGHAASDLPALLLKVLGAVSRLPDAEALYFEVLLPEEASVPIEQRDLTELLGNLLDNARKWARSTVRISYAAPLLTVEDDGPGVPEAELARLGERGRKLDESKQGAGLGLSIVEDIADIYGLSITYGRSGLGGLKVQICV